MLGHRRTDGLKVHHRSGQSTTSRFGAADAASSSTGKGILVVQSIGQSLTTPFKRTSTDPEYQFRVCGFLNSDNVPHCSDWW
jgi:hypothetical protein